MPASIILLGLALVLVLALLSGGMAFLLYRSRQREETLRQQLENLQNRLRQAMENQEEERKQFSGALHEEIGMRLHSIKLTLSRLAERIVVQSPEHGVELRRAASGLEGAARDIRALSDKLLPRVLAEQGLDAALADLTDQIFRHTPIEALYVESEAKGRYGQQVEIATYRMARELLSNAARHAGARKVNVQLRRDGHFLAFSVQDDGRGFDVNRRMRNQGGLDMLQSHLQTIGGKASFTSATGEGTTVTLRIPIS